MSKQRDEDFWKRINGATGIDNFEIIRKKLLLDPLSDEVAWGHLSSALSKMEDYFATVLEETEKQIPEQGFQIGALEDSNRWKINLMIFATLGLGSATSCRHEMEAGNAVSAAWEMHEADVFASCIDDALRDITNPLELKRARAMQAGRDTGLKAIGENRLIERDKRRGDYRLWRARKVQKEQIPREAARTWGVTPKHARKWLNENTGFATDS